MTVVATPLFVQIGGHQAVDCRQMLDAIYEEGGIVEDGGLIVYAATPNDMTVKVAAGRVVIPGSEQIYQGKYLCENRGELTLPIAAAHSSFARKDLVVARVYDDEYSTGPTTAFDIEVLTGTPSGTPADPAVPDNSWVLARVNVPALDSAIANGQIDDLRDSWPGQWTAFTRQAPRCGARVRKGTDTNITNTTATHYDFSDVESDTNGFWSVSTPSRLTVPTGLGGLYQCRAYIRWDATGPSAAGAVLGIYVNGTIVDRHVASAALTYLGQQISTPLRLFAGDYVELKSYQSSGATKVVSAVTTDSGIDPKSPVLELWRIGT